MIFGSFVDVYVVYIIKWHVLQMSYIVIYADYQMIICVAKKFMGEYFLFAHLRLLLLDPTLEVDIFEYQG